MTRTAVATAALAVACAVAVGCGATVDGVPVVGVTPTAATMAAPAAAAAAAANRWMDVTGQGVEAPRDNVDGAQYGPVPLPGTKVLHLLNSSGDMDFCTLGPAIRSVDGNRAGFLTAGHCGIGGYAAEQFLQTTADGETELLGIATAAEDDDRGIDSAAIWVPGGVDPRASSIAGFPVHRVMSAPEVRSSLPAGSPVCLNGALAGVACGQLLDPDDDRRIRFSAITDEGDSGAPVFVVDRVTKRATVIGILEGGNALTTTATYAEPALARLGAVLATAP
ncbi:hypothetical protein [[Mycobacterium] burgundiense]|uniref:Trypsin n=1 Tax=[Mycobacterium] burgundiense TaxID=3064286 RepID=A0ABM9LV68_9MYCO|nr:hypothetical protein [Mycolicibacterium sp. MU0053]CAJ1505269.1 hypothetical protein MU0053_002892 [Mycolicibacterium sp. MU0053]